MADRRVVVGRGRRSRQGMGREGGHGGVMWRCTVEERPTVACDRGGWWGGWGWGGRGVAMLDCCVHVHSPFDEPMKIFLKNVTENSGKFGDKKYF